MKKVACVLGSPRRNGNSETIANKFIETAASLGAETKTFRLSGLKFQGCIACMGCKTGSEKCVIKDDLVEVLAAWSEADVLVLTSPIYFGHVTGQAKSFIDRTFSYLVPDFMTNPVPSRLKPGKKFIFIQTQGDPNEDSHSEVYSLYAGFFKQLFGFENHLIRGLGVNEKTDAEGREDLLKQAEDLAKEVMA